MIRRSTFFGVALCVLTLPGCATYSDFRDRPADYAAVTGKAPQVYVECVLPRWMDTNAASHIVHDGDRRVIVVPVGGGTPTQVLMTLEASPTANGSRIEMKHMPSLSKFEKQWRQAQACL